MTNDDGASWLPVPGHATSGTDGWETMSFTVGDVVPPTAQVRVRFGTSDVGNNSVTEAGIDDFSIGQCPDDECAADLDGDGAVGVTELLALLAAWGPCPGCDEDLDGDGQVAVSDLLLLLAGWGPC